MELCCTQALLKQLNETAQELPHDSTCSLPSWTCKHIVYERKRYVLALNRETMLTLLVPGAPGASLRERLAESLAVALQAHGVSEEDIHMEEASMRAASFGKNRDRSLTGSLNDLASHVPYHMSSGFNGTTESLMKISAMLTYTPHCNRKPMWAKDSIVDIFGL